MKPERLREIKAMLTPDKVRGPKIERGWFDEIHLYGRNYGKQRRMAQGQVWAAVTGDPTSFPEIESLAAEAVSPRSEWNAGDWIDAAIVLAQGGFDLPEIRTTLAWAGRYTGVVVELGHPEAIARGWVTLVAAFRDGGKRVGQ